MVAVPRSWGAVVEAVAVVVEAVAVVVEAVGAAEAVAADENDLRLYKKS